MNTTMETDLLSPRHPIKVGEPAWDIALLFPPQGEWTEEEYLALDTTRLIELSEGRLEVLTIPLPFHQRIVDFLFSLLKEFVRARQAGEVFFAPLPVRLWSGKMREPDVIFVRPGRIFNPLRPPEGADLVMEVVSAGEESRERDLETKRREYALAGIAEYWIVDPEAQAITVLALDGKVYRVHGEFKPGMQATSVLLAGFAVDVAAVFAAGES